mgnify:CR=1 FL=1
MTDAKQREDTRQLAYKWQGKGNKVKDGRSYWLVFLTNVMGIYQVTARVNFE